MALDLGRASFPKGKRPAPSPTKKGPGLKDLAGLPLPLASYLQPKSTGDLCFPSDGTSHGPQPRQSVFHKKQTSGSFSYKEGSSPESSCWSSPLLGTLSTATTALGIRAFPETEHRMALDFSRASFPKGKRPAPSPIRKGSALKALAGLPLPLSPYLQAQEHWGSVLSQRRNISWPSASAERLSQKANIRLLLPEESVHP